VCWGVGEDSDVEVDIRVVAATSRDLEKMGRAGSFRTDLFHRLNVLSIQVPALHERADDLPLLTEYFLEKYRTLNATVSGTGIGTEFLEALRQLQLPGNVRQLENIVRQAIARRETNDPLGLRDLPVEVLQQLSASGPPIQPAPEIKNREVERVEIAKNVVRLLEINDWKPVALAGSVGAPCDGGCHAPRRGQPVKGSPATRYHPAQRV